MDFLTNCRLCPRLVQYRENISPKEKYQNQIYSRKPVPGFGDIHGRLFVLGLAPSSHGGNRTGRIFTGDDTGRFLFPILFEEGFANQSYSESLADNLLLSDCYLTTAVKCAPPKDRPTPEEFSCCSPFWWQELQSLQQVEAVLLFGHLSFTVLQKELKRRKYLQNTLPFVHGKSYKIPSFPKVYLCYHPSPRNTLTGKLTKEMLKNVLQEIKCNFS